MRPATGRTLAQEYCLIVGLVLVLVGALGFTADASFGSADDGKGEFLGFTVNGWHNVVHLLSGLLLLSLRGTPWRARAGALTFGVLYAVVAVWGIITGDSVLWIIPVDAADNILHVALAALAILAALASPSTSYVDPDATATRLTLYRPGHHMAAAGRPQPVRAPGGSHVDERTPTTGDTGGR
jgi:uncharacterized protein DUF4383